MFGPYTFLVYMLIFTVLPILILWLAFHRILWRNRHIIGWIILLGLGLQAVSDPVAEGWHAWYFPRETTLGIWIGNVPIENIIYTVLIATAISSAVLSLIHTQGGHAK